MCQIADLPENFALGLGMVSADILINLRVFFHNGRFADLMYVNPSKRNLYVYNVVCANTL